MLKKLIKPLLVVALSLSLFIGGISIGNGTGDKNLAEAKKQFEEALVAKNVVNTIKNQEIAELWKTISQLERGVKSRVDKIVELKDTIITKDTSIAYLIAKEPAAPELESHPLVINLRLQIHELTEGFTLCKKALAESGSLAFDLRTQYNLAIKVVAATDYKWQMSERALSASRVYVKAQEGAYKKLKLENIILKGTIATVIIGALYLVLKK